MEDQWGNPVTCGDPKALESIRFFLREMLALGKDATLILDATHEFPDIFLIQTYTAAFYLFSQTEESFLAARKYLAKAELLTANERERSLWRALREMSDLKISRALKSFEMHCRQWPRDLGALKITEFLYYMKGQQFEAVRFLETTEEIATFLSHDPYFLSIHSFALELNGHYQQAKESAEKALALENRNPWAHHTLSHVYIKTGDVDRGIQVLESFTKIWSESSHLIESHNLWHLALLYLENLDYAKTLEVYQRADWEHQSNLIIEEIDVASLLWRLDMDEVDVGDRWKTLAPTIDGHVNFSPTPFQNAQLCYALKRAGADDFLEEGLRSLEEFIQALTHEDLEVWRIGMPLIYGSIALAEGDYTYALDFLDPIIRKVGCVGGSDAQVDLFRQAYISALVKTKRYSDAKAYLNSMTTNKKLSMREKKWFEKCGVMAKR